MKAYKKTKDYKIDRAKEHDGNGHICYSTLDEDSPTVFGDTRRRAYVLWCAVMSCLNVKEVPPPVEFNSSSEACSWWDAMNYIYRKKRK